MYEFYWYPKCTTCQKAKKQLDEQEVSCQLVNLVATPPTKEQLLKWMSEGKFEKRRFFNTSGMKYRELGLKDKVADLSADEAAELLASDGMLIKRPLLVKDGKLEEIGYKTVNYQKLEN